MKISKQKFKLFVLAVLIFFSGMTIGFLGEVSAEGISADATMVTLDYKDANLATVLRALSYSYNLNLVVAKDVKGTVTVSLRDVSIDEALEAILSVNGYTFTRRGNIVYITPGPGLEGIDVVTQSVQLRYLAAGEAQRLLSKVISSRGSIEVNEATNSLVVNDFPANVEKLKKLLTEIDIPPTQVLIEAKIIDIEAKAFENFGTTYTLTYAPKGEERGIFDRDVFAEESLVNTTTLAGPSTNVSGGQLKLTATLKDFSATATIDALIQKNKAHLLASPSIATLNGREARIIIGEKFPYKEKTQTTTGTTETTKFIDVGTALRVTPLVSPDGWITMHVHPEVSSVSAALDAGPRITTREADATIRVRDGQTIIIGGLISKQDDHIKGGVPILRAIPFVGILFSKRSEDRQEKELTVFITPRIIPERTETTSAKGLTQEEVYLQVDSRGPSNLVDKLFEHAQNLERDNSAESANKSLAHRKEEIVNTYKQIISQFPHAQSVDKALFQMGLVYFDFFINDDDQTALLFRCAGWASCGAHCIRGGLSEKRTTAPHISFPE